MNVLLEFIMFPEKLVGRSQFESTPHNPTSPFFFQLCFLRIGKNMWWLTKANFITHQNLRANHYPPSAWGSEPEPSLQKKNPRKTKHLKTPSFRELRAGTTRKPPPKPKAPPRPPATKPMPRDPALRRPSWRWRNQPSSGKWDAEAKKMKRASFHFTMMMQGTQQTKELNLRPGTFPTQPNCPTKKKKPPPHVLSLLLVLSLPLALPISGRFLRFSHRKAASAAAAPCGSRWVFARWDQGEGWRPPRPPRPGGRFWGVFFF